MLNLVAKMRAPEQGGGRVAIVLNGSPLFTGAAGSGESEIRRHLLEQDLVEAIIALPGQIFYNTGIDTYIWVLTNRKAEERQGLAQLIDARDIWVKMRKSLGEKRRELSPEQITEIGRLHGAFEENDRVKILPNEQFGYRTIIVDRPLRAHWEVAPDTFAGAEDDKPLAKLNDQIRAEILKAVRGVPPSRYETEINCADALVRTTDRGVQHKPLLHTTPVAVLRALVARCLVRDPADPIVMTAPRNLMDPVPVLDAALRDTENVPLTEDVEVYLDREVRPHVEGARVQDPDGKVGYDIPLTRLFYRYTPPRPSEEIKAELREREARIRQLLEEVLV